MGANGTATASGGIKSSLRSGTLASKGADESRAAARVPVTATSTVATSKLLTRKVHRRLLRQMGLRVQRPMVRLQLVPRVQLHHRDWLGRNDFWTHRADPPPHGFLVTL